ncbi:gamma-glutamyltransferase family protein [Histidinibacterium aquaticum]|uniref:Gamma-glutamyltransferase family protein n=1 Tax=Histidinibacterium aquaticum TaxID=2613962 RepID=A0A5J5GDY1_9RHOB|nr:gamma-glutamyltransferase family protein [Histidinibacterium aquaticum]KAA9006012.1 gamma-glutamyltransferase family protein [Histidinibacterium aquaticum]
MRDFQLPGRSPVFATNGMCATSHPLAAKVAVQMLEAGGNAVDAALAGAVLLGVCEPQMTGIGGDLFALVSKPGEEPIALNGSGRAAAGTSAQALRDEFGTMPEHGPHSVTIPAAVDAICRLSEDHGRLGLGDILAPALHYAEAGVPVAPRVAFDWARVHHLGEAARRQLMPNGAPPEPGSLYRAPGMAEVLRRIAVDGRDAFYEGEVAEDMVGALQALGGPQTLEDFAAARSEYTTPISAAHEGHDLVEHPPNGQGAAALLMLNILQRLDIAGLDPFGAERAHLEAEAAKLAYDARNRFLADADHMTRLDHLLSSETADRLAALIRPDAVLPAGLEPAGAVHKDTVLITVVDRDRTSVSLIYSIFHSFGSGIATDKFGLLLHNRGAGFTLEDGHANEAGPGKRPMHTILPALLRKEGETVMPFGVMGGQYQAAGHARFVTNLLDFGLSPQEAIDAPRVFPTGGQLQVERGYPETVRKALADLGHDVITPDVPVGGAQAIAIRPDGMLEGASDPRKDGCALGY